jgi:proteasome lid subunit RPN8/RPN11
MPKLYTWLTRFEGWWRGSTVLAGTWAAKPAEPRRLERVVLSDGVAGTLFDDYAEHRRTGRGCEEIGWILLGHRREADALALAALPAGADRDASAVHVRFNADAQAIASRMLRQNDRRLEIVGVVHTHPGNLCQPSSGDLAGDSAWVKNLRTLDAVFGIGTARHASADGDVGGDQQFAWYALSAGDPAYRPLPACVEPGPDLAMALRPLWPTLETHAVALEKLCRLMAHVNFERAGDALAVNIALPDALCALRLLLKGQEARYYWDRHGELSAVEPREPQLDRAVLLILAELAKEAPGIVSSTSRDRAPVFVES